jgi:DNA-directed RNA polymerase specialized sigma24 family protein
MSRKNHYVNNNDFLDALTKYRESCDQAKEQGLKKPQIPEYVAKCIMMIAEKLSSKPNFYSYTFREEMVGDAIKNCIMYIDNFDPEKSSNPFAYFTQIVYYAFIQRINREKKQLYIKYKSSQEMAVLGEYDYSDNTSEDFYREQFELYDNINEFIDTYEHKQNIKKDLPRKLSSKKEFSPIEDLFNGEE